MSEIKRKTLEELESEFGDVMNNKVITSVTAFVPENEGIPFDEVEIKRRAQKYAPEVREIMQSMFGEA
jgi:hypothetical protein